MRSFLRAAITPVILILGILWWVTTVQNSADRSYRIAQETNVYNRTTACILSVPLATRTDEYISNCYNKAEAANDIKVDHYGNK